MTAPRPSVQSRADLHDDEILGKAYDARLAARLWKVTRPYRHVVLISAFLFLPISALELLQPYLMKVAIDSHILRGDWTGLTAVATAFLLALAGLYALRALQSYLMHLTGQRVMHDLRHRLFAHAQKMDAAFFDRNPVGRLMTRILNDVEAVSEMFGSGVVAILGDLVTLAGVVVVMLAMNWRLALVTFALVPLLFLVAAYFRARARTAYRGLRTRLARLNAFLQESLQGMTVIQLFAREPQERQRFQALNADYRDAQFRSTAYDASLYVVVEAIGSAAIALLLWYGGGQIWDGVLTFGGLVAFLEYTNRFFLPIRDLGAKYAVMQAAMASSERIFGLLDLEPAIQSGTDGDGAPAQARAGVGPARSRPPVVEFRNVWLAYEGEEWVLRDCSFAVKAGECVALVGVTGAGKSTIARLMNRSYDVTRGRVLVGGMDVREWDLTALRRHVGLIPQDVFLFTGSVEGNLRLSGDGIVSREVLERAVASANARSFIESLPDGFRYRIRERGANLSQGQRQLLAIARALVYNPAVLVLDEATSSVDPESEALIQSAMGRLLAGRTSLVIAHRLSTVKMADRILILHKGRVREEGTHAELLRLGGIYARLYELQRGG
ncbi:MAG: ABC transporter ATP-binding protein [Candidatus Rokubacteria bacterium]|nr:ABC transporter ATP-binding protein [Candidatus Rokubacteria bacterium]